MASRLVRVAGPVLVVVALLLVAGCGGGGSPSGVASLGTSTTATTGAATTTVPAGSRAGALAFARCMRAHGAPNWPDPQSDGGFDKSQLRALGIDPARIRAIEERSCHYDFQIEGHAQAITPAEQADYLRAAACMRRHGYAAFPDPTFPSGSVTLHIPSSIDQNAPRFRSAAETCTRLIPRGLPNSRPSGS